MKKNFEAWLLTMKDSIATWNYYVNFPKVYENVAKYRLELSILNSLIGSENIEEDFKNIIAKYPEVLKVIPMLLAKRESDIKILDSKRTYIFNFEKMNYTAEQYVLFMRNTGLFTLIQKHIINNLIDYVSGVEVGMDTNGRKNRTGDAMEDLVESYLVKAGLVKNKTYFKEMSKSEIEEKFKINLSSVGNNETAEKRFDFVFTGSLGEIYACECNFYSGGGSKLNETARSYKELAIETKNISRFNFVWFTDGIGWFSARHNLEETAEVLDNLYNIKDLEDGIIDKLINVTAKLGE